MKLTILFAAAALAFAGTAARAESEGSGDPFPFRVPGVATAISVPSNAPAVAAAPPVTAPMHEVAEAQHPGVRRGHL